MTVPVNHVQCMSSLLLPVLVCVIYAVLVLKQIPTLLVLLVVYHVHLDSTLTTMDLAKHVLMVNTRTLSVLLSVVHVVVVVKRMSTVLIVSSVQ